MHGEFVIEVRRGGDPAPLLLSPMLGKLLVHEKRDCIAGAQGGSVLTGEMLRTKGLNKMLNTCG